MGPVNADAAIGVQEAVDHVCTEHVASASVGKLEARGVAVWVGPHEVGEGTLVRDLFDSLDLLYVLDVL